jgi:2'-5' RNA ligase
VQTSHPGLRWTPAGQWHLTLAFLGEIDGDALDEGVLPDLTARLARAARRHPPQELALSGAGRFGDRVLWTRVRGDLRALAASVSAAARRCRIAVEDRPYRAHLTLARARPGTDLRPAVDALRDFTGTTWTATTLHLVRSTLGAGPGGTAAHEVIATWPLGRPAAPGDQRSPA